MEPWVPLVIRACRLLSVAFCLTEPKGLLVRLTATRYLKVLPPLTGPLPSLERLLCIHENHWDGQSVSRGLYQGFCCSVQKAVRWLPHLPQPYPTILHGCPHMHIRVHRCSWRRGRQEPMQLPPGNSRCSRRSSFPCTKRSCWAIPQRRCSER